MASEAPLVLPPGSNWLVDLIGIRAVRVLHAFAAPCLHYAHWQALARFWQDDWTNVTTYGVDRYHCFCWTFGQAVEQFVPKATVHKPTDRLGTPFTIEGGDWLIYPWRYGNRAADPHEGLRFTEERGIRSRPVAADPANQLMLGYPALPAIDLSRIVLLAWAGDFDDGMERAFVGRPYSNGRLLYWHETYELDLEIGRAKYGAHSAPEPVEGVSRNGQVAPPPRLDLDELARAHGLVGGRGGDTEAGGDVGGDQ